MEYSISSGQETYTEASRATSDSVRRHTSSRPVVMREVTHLKVYIYMVISIGSSHDES